MLLRFSEIKFLMTGILLLFLMILLNNNNFSQQSAYDINIEYEVNGQQLSIEGAFINNSEKAADVFYHIAITKKSKSGNSSTNQSGDVKIPVKSKTILSRSMVDLSNDAVYKIHLIVQNGKSVLADRELKLNGSEIQKH